MATLPENLVRVAATGINANTKSVLAQDTTVFSNTSNTAERNLLLTVATHAIQQQAGYIPETVSSPLPTASADDAKITCSLKAQHHLILMINGLHDNLLPLWFEKIEANNQTIPYEMIPTLLDYGARKRKLAPFIRQTLGERGIWLVENTDNRRWRWFTAENKKSRIVENRYEISSKQFKELRELDPETALKSLIESWSELDAIMKPMLIMSLEDKLSKDDIPFLLTCLDHDMTREIAFKLLLKLDETGLKEEVQEKIEELIILKQGYSDDTWVINLVESKLHAGHPLYLTPPTEEKDHKIRGYSFAPEAILMMLPLSYWYETYSATAENLITAASNSSRPEVFYRVWEGIAINENDTNFLHQLMRQVPHYSTPKLMNHLSPEQLMQLATERLNTKPIFAVDHSAVKILKTIKKIWNKDLTNSFLNSLQNAFKSIPRPMLDKKMREELLKYAEWIPLSSYNHFEKVIHTNARGDLSEAETEQINGIMSIIKFRVELLDAIETGNH